jgi:hypothetical protein
VLGERSGDRGCRGEVELTRSAEEMDFLEVSGTIGADIEIGADISSFFPEVLSYAAADRDLGIFIVCLKSSKNIWCTHGHIYL